MTGVKALVQEVLLPRHLCKSSYSPRLSQGSSSTGYSQNGPFGEKAAETLKVSLPGSSLLAHCPSCQCLANVCHAG